jgi:perosamine synthetase
LTPIESNFVTREMIRTIITSLAPNTESDDARLALSMLFKPWEWQAGSAVAELESEFKEYFGASEAVAFSSGRSALLNILRNIGLQNGDEVLLQAYTCVAVPDPVLWAGLKPVYVDIDKDSLNISAIDLEKKITSKSRALIIQHTFGVPANLGGLLEIAKKHSLFVVEDCAHALGAKYQNQKVGTFGQAGFFSFGRDKVISSVFGGMAITKRKALGEKMRKAQSSLPYPSRFWICRLLLHPILTNWVRVSYDRFGFGKVLFRISKLIKLLPKAVYDCERRGGKPHFIEKRFSNAMAILAIHQMGKLDRLNSHRENIRNMYKRRLPQVKSQSIPASSSPVFLRHAIFVEKSGQLLKEARRSKILLGDWYRMPVAPSGVSNKSIGYVTPCPNAERVASMSVNLPTDIHVNENDAERIIELVKNHIKTHAG